MIEPPQDDEQQRADPPVPRAAPERERYSTWSIALLILIVTLQIASSAGYDFSWKRSLKLTHEKASSQISSDAFQGLVETDDGAKAVYFQDALAALLPSSSTGAMPASPPKISSGSKPPHAVQNPLKPQTLADRLKPIVASSVDLLRRNPDDPAFARRVILLRAESGIDPFDPVPATPHHHGLPDPLQTYARAAATSKTGAPVYRREVALWSGLFSRRVTDQKEIDRLAAQIDRTPNLRWYKNLALHQLYLRAGQAVPARVALSHIRHEAGLSIIPQGILTVFVLALILLGIVVMIGVASRRFEPRRSDADTRPPDADLFGFFAVPLPLPITNDERRLRPRDLMDAFVVFLLMLNVVGYGVGELAVTFLRPHLSTLSPIEVNYANILVSAVGYVGGGAAATLFLFARARAVGASLAIELGLNKASLAANLGFGLVGWGVALLLVIIVAKIAGSALRAAPAPSNPALPLLISAPDLFTQVLLYALVAIAAPFFEELFFRGALMNALLPRFGPVVAIGLTGLLFGMVHPVGIAEVFSLATLGMVMAWAAYTRKSLVPSMTMHWLQNSFSYFTLYFTFLTIAQR